MMPSRRRLLRLAGGALGAIASSHALPAARPPRVAGVGWGKGWDEIRPFMERLAEAGLVEPRTLEMGYFVPPGRARERPEADWIEVARRAIVWGPDVIAVIGAGHVRRVRQLSPNVPIVFSGVEDPVAEGLVESLRRPGGNTTGAVISSDGLASKLLELTRETLPRARELALVFNSSIVRAGDSFGALRESARRLGFALTDVDLSSKKGGIQGGIERLEKARVSVALLVGPLDSSFHAERLLEYQFAARVPLVAAGEIDGGLLSLGDDARDHMRRMADVTLRVLQSHLPAGDIPIDVATRVELTANRATARRLGIELPRSIVVRADRLID